MAPILATRQKTRITKALHPVILRWYNCYRCVKEWANLFRICIAQFRTSSPSVSTYPDFRRTKQSLHHWLIVSGLAHSSRFYHTYDHWWLASVVSKIIREVSTHYGRSICDQSCFAISSEGHMKFCQMISHSRLWCSKCKSRTSDMGFDSPWFWALNKDIAMFPTPSIINSYSPLAVER